ncbi:helix-turn-helix domain-containing protein (plasmid) [Kovacikia minuta CCNUW1]|uniref:helix-turn-helix domain-containing protein n=1 Tax=Kovacikia minuta TaxID=2931930 RepID=UPI001CCDA255|nr:helix-turn-helix domain-containing protein [Kovacikia minuta]UBF30569.1 helix-turn-helix domain-containing protein [Kovacikia minuta CCNUW1]
MIMSRPRIQIVPHLNDTELIRRYETCQDGKIKSHWQVILLMSQQNPYLTVEQVAEQVNFSADWVRKLVHRYNRFGPRSITHESRSLRRSRHLMNSSRDEIEYLQLNGIEISKN